jgi:DNA-binding CsgD family transcriptional regulator
LVTKLQAKLSKAGESSILGSVKQLYKSTGNTTKNGVTTVRYVHLVILSDQERAIVWMLVLGVSRKDIAHTLKIGAETLKTHIARVMGPLHLYGMTQLTRWALTHQGSMAGEAVSPDLHPAGCECKGGFCLGMRLARKIGTPTVVLPLPGGPLFVVEPGECVTCKVPRSKKSGAALLAS